MKNRLKKLYIAMFVLCLAVLGGMTFFEKKENINEAGARRPQLFREGRLNEDFLDDAENYVVRNFGFRNEILEIYTSLQEQIFHHSVIDKVVIGENGYLFLEETVDDYTGNKELSEREMFQIKRNLELMQEYVESQEGKFLFVIAPNKNSLYDKMPSNYKKSNKESLATTLMGQLEHVSYANLFRAFGEEKAVLYYKTDTHWNEQGARFAYDAILTKLEKEHDDFEKYPTKETLIKGDLYQMLYPQRDKNEKSFPYQKKKAYQFVTKTRSHEEFYIVSVNENATDSLLMFRDSFGNNLIPFFSDSYRYAVYDKRATYDFFQMEAYNNNTVIVEIAERNLADLQSKEPAFVAPERQVKLEGVCQNFLKECVIEQKDSYIFIKGSLEEKYLESESLIFLEKDGCYYELTPQLIEGEYGFVGYLPLEDLNGATIWLKGNEKSLECELKAFVLYDIVERQDNQDAGDNNQTSQNGCAQRELSLFS